MKRIPTPRLLLRAPNSGKVTPIHLVIRYDGKPETIRTGESIHPQYWDKLKQLVKNNRDVPNSSEINLRFGVSKFVQTLN